VSATGFTLIKLEVNRHRQPIACTTRLDIDHHSKKITIYCANIVKLFI
jgi:hypothetical protein